MAPPPSLISLRAPTNFTTHQRLGLRLFPTREWAAEADRPPREIGDGGGAPSRPALGTLLSEPSPNAWRRRP